MTDPALIIHDLKDRIMAEPDMILEDREVMRALIDAEARRQGGNIVDLRGIAMERLETRLDRLEDTHRSVIAAAYENLAGTNQIHRAILSLLEPKDFTSFLQNLSDDVAAVLRVPHIRLVLETTDAEDEPLPQQVSNVLAAVKPGTLDRVCGAPKGGAPEKVTLRPTDNASPLLYGDAAAAVHSEALLKLDFGAEKLPGLLALGSDDPHQFRVNQGTDLLNFFASVVERAILRWIG